MNHRCIYKFRVLCQFINMIIIIMFFGGTGGGDITASLDCCVPSFWGALHRMVAANLEEYLEEPPARTVPAGSWSVLHPISQQAAESGGRHPRCAKKAAEFVVGERD